MSNKIPLTKEALQQHLIEQLQFLESSADAYDQGFDGEAKRLATTMRVLLHDTRNSSSLLGQLGRLNGSFITTALPDDPRNLGTYGGLVALARDEHGAKYVAMLDDVPYLDWLPFNEWWNQTVFVDDRKEVLSRRQVVPEFDSHKAHNA